MGVTWPQHHTAHCAVATGTRVGRRHDSTSKAPEPARKAQEGAKLPHVGRFPATAATRGHATLRIHLMLNSSSSTFRM